MESNLNLKGEAQKKYSKKIYLFTTSRLKHQELKPLIEPNTLKFTSNPEPQNPLSLLSYILLLENKHDRVLFIVSYKTLSSRFLSFTTNLDREKISKDIHETLRIPK